METPDQATTKATQTDPSTSYLEQLVGEGKKYSNPEELAKAYFNADGFINHLKNETGSLREELDKRMTLEELLAVKQQEQQISTEPKAVGQPQETPVIEPQPTEKVDLDLGAEVRRILTEESVKKTADSNLETVMNSLMSTYGDADKAREEVLVVPNIWALTAKPSWMWLVNLPKPFSSWPACPVKPRRHLLVPRPVVM